MKQHQWIKKKFGNIIISSSFKIGNEQENKESFFYKESINQEFTVGKDKTLSFTIIVEDTDKEHRTVYIDGEELSLSNRDYTSQNLESYPYITISENYMKTLKTGTHTIKIVLNDGKEAETTFEIIEATGSGIEGVAMPEPDAEGSSDDTTTAPTSTPTSMPTSAPTTNNPQTGDNIWLFVGLLGISIVGILLIRKYKIN